MLPEQGEDLMRKIRERFRISDRFRKILWVLIAAVVIMDAATGCVNYIVTENISISEDTVGNTAENTIDDKSDTLKFHTPQLYAWWGTIYPEFCFEKGEDTDETKPVKLSFWLAKALDW